MLKISILPLALISLYLTSCGWHMTQEFSQEHRSTIAIPYVAGDQHGKMTSSLVSAVQKQAAFRYVREGGDFILQVTLLDSKSENIGFRYDPEKLSNGKRQTIPNETRRKLLASVSVIDARSGQTVFGPTHVLSSTEFDHQYYNLNHNTNAFSLGQLTDVDTTYDVVDIPLYRELSHNIAALLANNAHTFGVK